MQTFLHLNLFNLVRSTLPNQNNQKKLNNGEQTRRFVDSPHIVRVSLSPSQPGSLDAHQPKTPAVTLTVRLPQSLARSPAGS